MSSKEGFWLRPEEVALITTVIEDKQLVEARHSQIIEAGTRLFEKKGYHATTIREIVKESGLGIGSIYQYVKNKEEILFLILVYILRQYEYRLSASIANCANPREQLISAIKTYYHIVNEESDKVLLAYRETKSLNEDHRKHIMELELLTNNIFKKIIEQGIEENIFRKVNVDLITYNIIMFGHMWALKRWFFKNIMTIDEYIRLQTENILAVLDMRN